MTEGNVSSDNEAITVQVKLLHGTDKPYKIEPSDTVLSLRERITESGPPLEFVWLIYNGWRLKDDERTVFYYGVKDGGRIDVILPYQGHGPDRAGIDYGRAVFCSEESLEKQIEVDTFYLLPRSDDHLQLYADYAGIMVLEYDGQVDWTLNGVHCRSGCIYLKEISAFEEQEDNIYGRLFSSLFDKQLDKKVVGCGFRLSLQAQTCEFKCEALNNGKDPYHADNPNMLAYEEICILATIENLLATRSPSWAVGGYAGQEKNGLRLQILATTIKNTRRAHQLAQ